MTIKRPWKTNNKIIRNNTWYYMIVSNIIRYRWQDWKLCSITEALDFQEEKSRWSGKDRVRNRDRRCNNYEPDSVPADIIDIGQDRRRVKSDQLVGTMKWLQVGNRVHSIYCCCLIKPFTFTIMFCNLQKKCRRLRKCTTPAHVAVRYDFVPRILFPSVMIV